MGNKYKQTNKHTDTKIAIPRTRGGTGAGRSSESVTSDEVPASVVYAVRLWISLVYFDRVKMLSAKRLECQRQLQSTAPLHQRVTTDCWPT